MSEKRIRLFVAVSVPEEQLGWLQAGPLRRRWPEARWAAPENQHVTLKFLGATSPDRLEPVTAVCRSVAAAHRPATLRLGELGAFPSPRRARVLWVGLDDPGDVLAGLARDLDAALEPLGYRAETRPYTAHLTLARFRDPLRLEALPVLPPPPPSFPLEAIGLWRSHLSPRGARYERLAALALGHAP